MKYGGKWKIRGRKVDKKEAQIEGYAGKERERNGKVKKEAEKRRETEVVVRPNG